LDILPHVAVQRKPELAEGAGEGSPFSQFNYWIVSRASTDWTRKREGSFFHRTSVGLCCPVLGKIFSFMRGMLVRSFAQNPARGAPPQAGSSHLLEAVYSIGIDKATRAPFTCSGLSKRMACMPSLCAPSIKSALSSTKTASGGSTPNLSKAIS
jgi:hypothetical protein